MSDTNTSAAPAGMSIESILAGVLAETQRKDFGAKIITGDEVEFHDGVKIGLPRNMTYGKAKKVLTRLEEEAETLTHFSHVFRYRPDDGAYAALQVIKAKWGMALGKVQHSFFGTIPAEKRTINIGVGQTMQVPWGLIEIPIFEGLELYLAEHRDRDYGVIFQIHGQGPRKYQDEIQGFFDDIEEYLRDHSIYRGQAIVGSDDPEFLDLEHFDASKIIFSDEVTATLNGTLFAPIRYTDAMRREGISLKRALLLEGPYGTGKTSIWGNSFFLKEGPGKFREVSDEVNAENYCPWGPSVGDLNADGYDDTFIASGMNYPFRYSTNAVKLNDGGRRGRYEVNILGAPSEKAKSFEPIAITTIDVR